jgi:hypothetical protein
VLKLAGQGRGDEQSSNARSGEEDSIGQGYAWEHTGSLLEVDRLGPFVERALCVASLSRSTARVGRSNRPRSSTTESVQAAPDALA